MNESDLNDYPYMTDVTCWECGNKLDGYPELFVHLQQDHDYHQPEALESIESEINKIPATDNGTLCGTCPDHGLYALDEWECPGCRAVDQEIDRWKEER